MKKIIRKLTIWIVAIMSVGAISTVSFAAWSNEISMRAGNISVGDIEYLNFTTNSASVVITGENNNDISVELFPHDQHSGFPKDGARYLTVILSVRTNVAFEVGIRKNSTWQKLSNDSGLYYTTERPEYSPKKKSYLLNGTMLNQDEDIQYAVIGGVSEVDNTTIKTVNFVFFLMLASDNAADMGKILSFDLQLSGIIPFIGRMEK